MLKVVLGPRHKTDVQRTGEVIKKTRIDPEE